MADVQVTLARTVAAVAIYLVVSTALSFAVFFGVYLTLDWATLVPDRGAYVLAQISASPLGAFAAIRAIQRWPKGFSRRAVLGTIAALWLLILSSVVGAGAWADIAIGLMTAGLVLATAWHSLYRPTDRRAHEGYPHKIPRATRV